MLLLIVIIELVLDSDTVVDGSVRENCGGEDGIVVFGLLEEANFPVVVELLFIVI